MHFSLKCTLPANKGTPIVINKRMIKLFDKLIFIISMKGGVATTLSYC